MIVVRSQIKELLKDEGIDNISKDFLDRLDEEVKAIVLRAVKRAKENQRRTAMGRDI